MPSNKRRGTNMETINEKVNRIHRERFKSGFDFIRRNPEAFYLINTLPFEMIEGIKYATDYPNIPFDEAWIMYRTSPKEGN
jgi:hypothetical protein